MAGPAAARRRRSSPPAACAWRSAARLLRCVPATASPPAGVRALATSCSLPVSCGRSVVATLPCPRAASVSDCVSSCASAALAPALRTCSVVCTVAEAPTVWRTLVATREVSPGYRRTGACNRTSTGNPTSSAASAIAKSSPASALQATARHRVRLSGRSSPISRDSPGARVMSGTHSAVSAKWLRTASADIAGRAVLPFVARSRRSDGSGALASLDSTRSARLMREPVTSMRSSVVLSAKSCCKGAGAAGGACRSRCSLDGAVFSISPSAAHGNNHRHWRPVQSVEAELPHAVTTMQQQRFAEKHRIRVRQPALRLRAERIVHHRQRHLTRLPAVVA